MTETSQAYQSFVQEVRNLAENNNNNCINGIFIDIHCNMLAILFFTFYQNSFKSVCVMRDEYSIYAFLNAIFFNSAIPKIFYLDSFELAFQRINYCCEIIFNFTSDDPLRIRQILYEINKQLKAIDGLNILMNHSEICFKLEKDQSNYIEEYENPYQSEGLSNELRATYMPTSRQCLRFILDHPSQMVLVLVASRIENSEEFRNSLVIARDRDIFCIDPGYFSINARDDDGKLIYRNEQDSERYYHKLEGINVVKSMLERGQISRFFMSGSNESVEIGKLFDSWQLLNNSEEKLSTRKLCLAYAMTIIQLRLLRIMRGEEINFNMKFYNFKMNNREKIEAQKRGGKINHLNRKMRIGRPKKRGFRTKTKCEYRDLDFLDLSDIELDTKIKVEIE